MDLERELQRVLHTRDVAARVTDPVSAVHAGMRRRRRAQRVQMLSTGVGVVAVVVGAALLVGNPLAGDPRPAPAASQEPTVKPPTVKPPTVKPPTVKPPTVKPPTVKPPTVKPPSDLNVVPRGFSASDLSFVTIKDGWAVGTAPCGAKRCTIELVTTDGGATWARPAAVGLPRTCDNQECVRHVRFANARVGYAFGTTLYLTNDGGASWSRQRTPPVYGLEIANGTVTRVVTPTPGCPGCRFIVQTSQVGNIVWKTAYSSNELRAGAMMVRHGNRIAVALFANPAGGAGDAHASLLLSTDDGASFTRRDDPCGPVTSNAVDEKDTTDLSFGPEGTLAVLCTARMAHNGGGTTIRLSADGGKSFGPARSVPAPADAHQIASVNAGRVIVEAFPNAGGQDALLLTENAGQTWTEVATQAQAGGSVAGPFLAFSTRRTGTWLGPDGSSVWRTTDGGTTWTEHPLR